MDEIKKIGMKELADFLWRNLTPEGKIELFKMSTGLPNPTAIKHWEKLPEAVEDYMIITWKIGF